MELNLTQGPMARTDAATVWSLQYRVSVSVISDIAPEIAALGLDAKELFVLADQAGLLRDPELASERMRHVLALAGVE